MRRVALIVLFLSLFARVCSAGLLKETIVTNQSCSGLFIVKGPPISSKALFFNNFAGNSPLKLDPALLVVSCEQIKDLLLRELGYNIRQQLLNGRRNYGLGKVFVVLHENADEPIAFSAFPSPAGLSYRVDMPNEMFASRMIETMVQILLLDMANMNNNGATVSPPVWLVEGMVAHLQSVGLETLPLEANLPVTKVKTRQEPVALVREHLHERAPLTFEEMSWPEKLSTERAGVYTDSAQLFVYELMRLKEGRFCLRKMINTLPKYKNWQFAFFDAFQGQFSQTVDVEKWWALSLVNFTGRDPLQVWSVEESHKKLDAALKVSAQIYNSQNAMPQRASLTFQQVITSWDYARQQIAIQKAVIQLRNLRYRVAPDLLETVDNYRATLDSYLRDRRPEKLKKDAANTDRLARSTCKKLDELDHQYASLEKKPAKPVSPAKPTKTAKPAKTDSFSSASAK